MRERVMRGGVRERVRGGCKGENACLCLLSVCL